MDLLQMGAQIMAQQLGGNSGSSSLLDSFGGMDAVVSLAKGFFK